ncbi:hypothetical protein AK812_SmicGene32291 [Symbiodinium microadriaticum]|uniref:Uncharacterized protein n=1 Tax=Symbiodinium microadriaticum TaxID=2951 RepID=A0A1Q9CUL6_SYMMI|nr:hypothetical protein AK812_SmicGene32291 [Symbiodinium microadriaticum]
MIVRDNYIEAETSGEWDETLATALLSRAIVPEQESGLRWTGCFLAFSSRPYVNPTFNPMMKDTGGNKSKPMKAMKAKGGNKWKPMKAMKDTGGNKSKPMKAMKATGGNKLKTVQAMKAAGGNKLKTMKATKATGGNKLKTMKNGRGNKANPNPHHVTGDGSGIQSPSNAGAYFVLPSQMNAAEYPHYAPEAIVRDVNDYRWDRTAGPRGQLSGHPAVAQFLLDNASTSARKGGINTVREMLRSLRTESTYVRPQSEVSKEVKRVLNDFKLQNGYLAVPNLAMLSSKTGMGRGGWRGGVARRAGP